MARILIVGVGAIGSNLTSLLVPDLKGEHEITVLDMDKIEERNVRVGTQFFFPDQIGLSKVAALQYNIYKMFNREISIDEHQLIQGDEFLNYDLIIDCLDNHEARKIIQDGWRKTLHSALPSPIAAYDLLHIGFSDQFTFAIEWAENYKVPEDITSGLDICEMEGAASFIKLTASIASLVVQEFIRKEERLEYIGNRLAIRRMA